MRISKLKYGLVFFLFLSVIGKVYCANCISSQPVNQTICSGGSATFSVNTSGSPTFQWQYKNGPIWTNWVSVSAGFPTGATYTNGTTATMTVSGVSVVGTYQYRCNVTGGSCNDTSSIWVTLTVIAPPSSPTATISPNVSVVCVGSSLTLTNPTFGSGGLGCSFEYATSTNGGSTYSSFSSVVPTITATGTDNRIRIRSTCTGSGCNTSSSTTYSWSVVSDPLAPTAIPSPNVTSVCVGQSLSLAGVTNNGGGTGTCNVEYSNNGGAFNTTLSPITASIGTNSITIRQNCNGSGCTTSPSNTYSWTVIATPSAPTATISPNVSLVCVGSSLTLTNPTLGNGGIGCSFEYATSTDGGATYSAFSTIVPTITATGTDNKIKIRSTCTGNGCGTSPTTTYSWSVVQDPSVPTAAPSPNIASVCEGQILTLTGVVDNGGGTGTCNIEYSINGGTFSTAIPSFPATVGTNTITIRKNCNGSGCDISPVNSYSWTVVADPIAPTAIQVPANTTVCAGQLLSVIANDNGGGTGTCNIEYSINGGTFSTAIPSFPATVGTNTITIRKNCNGSGCDISAINTYTWNANPLPVPITSNNDTICRGTNTTLFVAGGVSYVWTPQSTLNFAFIANPTASPLSTTTYTVTVTGANTCIATSTITISVNPLPNANAGNNTSICPGASTILNSSGGTSYSWSPSIGLNNPSISNPIANPTNTTTYTVSVTDLNNCVNTDNVTISVNSLPTANAGSDVSICHGANTTLNATGGTSYSWSPSAGLNNTNVSNPIANPTSTTNYTVNVTDINGCSASDQVLVSINPLPTPHIIGDTTVCKNAYWSNYITTAINNDGFLWSVTGGSVMSGQYSNNILVHWDTVNYGSVNVIEHKWITGCESSNTRNVAMYTTTAPDTTAIILKHNSSNILICVDSTFTQYQWGYENKISGVAVFTCVNTQYCQFPSFDPTINYYWCVVGKGNGCETKSYYNTPDIIFSIGDIALQNKINIYPNPTSDNFEIELNLGISYKHISITIYNSLGQIVSLDKINNPSIGKTKKSIGVQSFESGIYHLQLMFDDGTFINKKVVIQK